MISKFVAVLLAIALFGSYTSISVYSADVVIIPSVITLAMALLFIATTRRMIPRQAAGLLLVVAVFLLIHALLILSLYGSDIGAISRSSGNMLFSLVLGTIFFRMATFISSSLLSRVLACFVVFLIFGALAEQYLGLRVVSDAFRLWAYPQSLYVADDRDNLLFGGIRPKVFSPEPSFVGLWFANVLAAWVALAAPKKVFLRVVPALIALVLMAYLLRSATLIFALPIIATLVIGRTRSVSIASFALRRASALPMILVIVLSLMSASLIPANSNSFVNGDSFFGRVVAPPRVAGSVIIERPILGLGAGNQDDLLPLALKEYYGRAIYDGGYQEATSARSLLTNSFYFQIIYFGLLGFLFLVGFYTFFLKALGVTNRSFVIYATFISWFMIGGLVTVQAWSFFFLFAAVAWHLERDEENELMSFGVGTRDVRASNVMDDEVRSKSSKSQA